MHSLQSTIKTACLLGGGVLASLFLTACDDSPQAGEGELPDGFFTTPKQTVPRVHRNQIGRAPSGFLSQRATDPCHWQAWSPQVFEDAESEQRLVFTLIGSGRHRETLRLLDKLRESPAIIDILHKNYVCCLADLEMNPELGTLMALLCAELERPVSFPSMMWLSHEGNPVAWIPLREGDIDDFRDVFGNANIMVEQTWRDSPGYVVRNSRRDNENRQERSLPPSDLEDDGEELPDLETVFQGSLRQLTSLYDPASKLIDGTGGLVPAGILNLAALAGSAPGTPEWLAKRALALLEGTCDVLAHAAIRDPLDGGFFSARRAQGWDLPVFTKATDTQSQMIQAYARASLVLDSSLYLETSRDILSYTDRNFSQGGDGLGLYEFTPSPTLDSRAFLWPQEILRELLTDPEFQVAKATFQTTGIGNIPPESDPKRDFFRKNSLGMKQTPAEVAVTLGITEEAANETFDAVRRRLLSQRQELLNHIDGSFIEEMRITETNARFVSALATFSPLSDDPKPLARANAILTYLKSRHYSKQSGLLRIPQADGQQPIRARGADYAAFLNALLDVYRLDLDPDHLVWATNLATELLDTHLSQSGSLLEVPVDAQIGLLEISNRSMIFGDSTWGTIYGPLKRLHQLTGSDTYRKTSDLLQDSLIRSLQASGYAAAMVHTDFLRSAMVPLADTIVYLSGEPGSEEFDALHALLQQPRFQAVTILHLQAELPAGIQAPISPTADPSALVFSGEIRVGEARSPADLEVLLVKALTGK